MSRGHIEVVLHESRLLTDNPLGDPSVRELGVYLPPGYDASQARYPTVLVLPGYTGTGLGLVARSAWQLPLDRRMDQLVLDGRAQPAILVLPDCFTRYGGSQYVDSPAVGRYASYLCDEIIPFVDARFRTTGRRGVIGKSSGGYGALHLAMTRPDLFCAAASHAGDCAFDISYRRELPIVAARIDAAGGLARYLARFEAADSRSSADIEAMSIVCCAAAWSPSPSNSAYGFGLGFELPMELRTGALRPDVWARWLAADPLHLVVQHADALRGLSLLFLDAGRSDEYALQLGARQLSDALTAHSIPHMHEEFEGGHRHTAHRYDRSLALVTNAL
ncbi:MAG: alpha/beta hydrolase-fold protein [Polyangia bacterium]